MPIAGAMQCPAVLSNTFLAHRRGSESCAQPRCWWPRRRAKNALHYAKSTPKDLLRERDGVGLVVSDFALPTALLKKCGESVEPIRLLLRLSGSYRRNRTQVLRTNVADGALVEHCRSNHTEAAPESQFPDSNRY
jgi:hypothetical protein